MKNNTMRFPGIHKWMVTTGKILLLAGILAMTACSATKHPKPDSEGWITLFDGKTLNGWEAPESPESFRVEDGVILAKGPKSHLYYTGPVMDHDFKNFEFLVDIKTEPGANSGVYFHTTFQEVGYPDDGFEVQVNNSSGDWKRTGSLYDIVDFGDTYVEDNEWFTMYIKVVDKNVLVKLNDRTVLEWDQPDGFTVTKAHPGRIISSGTFAFQEHDARSVIRFRNIKVRPLP